MRLSGFIAGILCSLIVLTGASFAPHAHMPLAPAVGLFAVILCPSAYGTIGGIAAVIGALIYNLASNWAGGIEVDIS